VSVTASWPTWTRIGSYCGLARLMMSSLLEPNEHDIGAIPVEITDVLA
jgi:hypothetical protein